MSCTFDLEAADFSVIKHELRCFFTLFNPSLAETKAHVLENKERMSSCEKLCAEMSKAIAYLKTSNDLILSEGATKADLLTLKDDSDKTRKFSILGFKALFFLF